MIKKCFIDGQKVNTNKKIFFFLSCIVVHLEMGIWELAVYYAPRTIDFGAFQCGQIKLSRIPNTIFENGNSMGIGWEKWEFFWEVVGNGVMTPFILG